MIKLELFDKRPVLGEISPSPSRAGRLLFIKPESLVDEVVHGLFRKRNSLRAEGIAYSGKSQWLWLHPPTSMTSEGL
jgi:hypothetical protein